MNHLPQIQNSDTDEHEHEHAHEGMQMMSAMNTGAALEDEFAANHGAEEQKRLAAQSAILIAIVAVVAGGILFGMRMFSGDAVQAEDSSSMTKINAFLRKAENPDLVSTDDPLHAKRREDLQRESRILQKITNDFAEKGVPLEQVAKNPFAIAELEKPEVVAVDTSAEDRAMLLAQYRQKAERLDLQSIMGSGRRSVAVIGGSLYQVGDTIDEFRIVRIRPGQVFMLPVGFEMQQGDQPIVLEIAEKIEARRF